MMNMRMMAILVRKDIALVLMPVLLYSAVGLLSIGLMAARSQSAFYAGSVLMISAMMALGFHPAMATIVGERKEQTLAFVLSMPTTPLEYMWAKIGANLVLFFVPWALLAAATMALFAASPDIPDGLMPYSMILFGAIASGALCIVAVAIATESMQLTIATQIISNLAFQAVMFGASNLPAIKANLHGAAAVWDGPVLTFLAAELAIGLSFIAAAVWLQSRKTSFI